MKTDHDEAAGKLSGLQWLTRERPEAMQHLLAFFGASARHLEPKTRFLISVVTKVINFSPRGLRQYIPRALREGASRDEVLDAILCAYPAAGLTRVVDAVDILRTIPDPALDAGRPEEHTASGVTDARDAGQVSPAAAAPESGPGGSARSDEASVWHATVALAALRQGCGRRVTVAGRTLALFRLGDTVHAIANACVHRGGELAGGAVADTVVTCPVHGWQFDLVDGHCLNREGAAVEVYDTEIRDGIVGVFL